MGVINEIFYASVFSASLVAAQVHADTFTGDEIRSMFFEPKYDVSYPSCVHNGQEVTYREETLVEMLHGRGQAVAQAAQDETGPYILVNAELLSSAAPAFTEFVLQHECNHHQHGHIDDFSREHYAEREVEADCEAIKTLKAEGFTQEDLSVLDAYNRALVQAFYPAQEQQKSAQERNQRIRNCYFADEAMSLAAIDVQ